MRTQRGLPYGLTLIALLGLAFAGWVHSNPASAQDDANKPAVPLQPGPGMMMHGPVSLAASGDYVYVLRGNTLFQMKAADLSLVKQQDLPSLAGAAAAPGADNSNANK
jgi:hypothetical protein